MSPGAMAQRRPESAAAGAGFHQLAEELAGLRQEVAGLRTTLAELMAALAPGRTPAAAQSPAREIRPAGFPSVSPRSAAGPEPAPGPGDVRPMGASPSALLARRNAERLAGEVQRRAALASDLEDDTELDLLIDRLHELALTKGPGSEGP